MTYEMQRLRKRAATARPDTGGSGIKQRRDAYSSLPPDVRELYLELSRRARAAAAVTVVAPRQQRAARSCRCAPRAGARPTALLPANTSTGRRAGTRMYADRKRTFAKMKDVVVAGHREPAAALCGGRPAPAKEGRWLVMGARSKSLSLHADKLRLVVPAEEREDAVPMG